VTLPVGTAIPDVGPCQIEVYRTGDTGPAGAPGANGTNGVNGAPGTTYIGDTPPGSPFIGQQWFESDTGKLYVYYFDGTSAQWVQLIGAGGGGGGGTGDMLGANNLAECTNDAAARGNIGAVCILGDVMLGALSLPGQAIPAHATRKDYVDAADLTLTGSKLSKLADDTAAGEITFAKSSGHNETALTYGATTNWNVQTAPVATLSLAGNTTIAAPTNVVAGHCYHIRIVQNASSTVAWTSANYKFIGGSVPVMTTGTGKVDRYTFIATTGNVLEEVGRAQGIA
jgi:hypothetical protein